MSWYSYSPLSNSGTGKHPYIRADTAPGVHMKSQTGHTQDTPQNPVDLTHLCHIYVPKSCRFGEMQNTESYMHAISLQPSVYLLRRVISSRKHSDSFPLSLMKFKGILWEELCMCACAHMSLTTGQSVTFLAFSDCKRSIRMKKKKWHIFCSLATMIIIFPT